MSILISEQMLSTTGMSEAQMRQEIAILLVEQEKLTLAQASHFARVNPNILENVLASRQIPVNGDLNLRKLQQQKLKYFPETTLHQVAGCLKYKGTPKTLDELEQAIGKGIKEQWNDIN
ncbi:UPF0175 family protein [Roseofilum casamattae]|uniref:UPF0175 family protein n=1 Tax=Roseofilum casamattae BLCC-M143 TaxID=3022442 RepID=A0ABT7BXP8_9CYAN|nr:UPF0175 family protein [Roseofilum casamattae]MDJ1183969.1 UPF0175 family protein [Roseofilum casamattae BLCC-M143]